MSRDVKKCERQLIEILQNKVESSESDFKSRMINVDRDVFLDEPTYNVVEKTKITNTIPSIPEFYLAKNDDSLYICNTYNKQYDSVFLEKLKEIDDIKAYAEEINNEDEIEKAISDKIAYCL